VAYNPPTAREHRAKDFQELEAKQLKLIDLIQSLGEYLNNEDAVLRTKSKKMEGTSQECPT
jgi:hypothetical protein